MMCIIPFESKGIIFHGATISRNTTTIKRMFPTYAIVVPNYIHDACILFATAV